MSKNMNLFKGKFRNHHIAFIVMIFFISIIAFIYINSETHKTITADPEELGKTPKKADSFQLIDTMQLEMQSHPAEIRSIHYTSDGKYIISSADSGVIKMWSAENLESVRNFSDYGTFFAFNSEKNILFTSSESILTQRELDTGNEISSFKFPNCVSNKVVSSDCCFIAFTKYSKAYDIHVISTISGIEVLVLKNLGIRTVPISFINDNHILVTYNKNLERMDYWSIETGKIISSFEIDSRPFFSHDCKSFAYQVKKENGKQLIIIQSVETNNIINSFEIDSRDSLNLFISSNGKLIATDGFDRNINIWEVTSGNLINTIKVQSRMTHYGCYSYLPIVFSPDYQTITLASLSGRISTYSIESGDLINSITAHYAPVISLAFSPDGKILASGGYDETINLWTLPTGERLHSYNSYYDLRALRALSSLAFNPDGKTLLAGGWKEISIFNIEHSIDRERPDDRTSFQVKVAFINSISFSSDGQTVILGGFDNTSPRTNFEKGKIAIKSIEGWRKARHIETKSLVFCSDISPDGQIALSGHEDSLIRLWSVETGKLIKALKGHEGRISKVAFSPDGTLIASAGQDDLINMWNMETGELLWSIRTDGRYFTAMDFSPDGQMLISASKKKVVNFWSVETGELVRAIEDFEYSVYSAIFSPDGKSIATGSGDGWINIWSIE